MSKKIISVQDTDDFENPFRPNFEANIATGYFSTATLTAVYGVSMGFTAPTYLPIAAGLFTLGSWNAYKAYQHLSKKMSLIGQPVVVVNSDDLEK